MLLFMLSWVLGSKLYSIAMASTQWHLSFLGDLVTLETWELDSLQWFILSCQRSRWIFCPACIVLLTLEQKFCHFSLVPWERAVAQVYVSLRIYLHKVLPQLAKLILVFWTQVLTDGGSVYIESDVGGLWGWVFFSLMTSSSVDRK